MEKKKRRKLKFLPFVIFCSFLMLFLGVGYVLANQFIFDNKLTPLISSTETDEVADLDKRLNFLLLGIDAREGEKNTRTDSMILVSVDKENNRIAMISLPRDTRVKIPGHGYDKINAANVYGGPEMATKVVSDLVGLDIDKYITTNVRGFRDIVDTLGGVTIDVEKKMYHYDPYDEPDLQRIDLKPGVQKLNGDKALQYVRYRSDALGDVSRTERQQKFLKVLAKEMIQPSTITKLPKLVPTINKYIDTNLSLTEMIALANAGKHLSNVEIVTQTMPGKFLNMNGVSYWSIDPKQAKMVAESIIKEGKVYDVVLGEENIDTRNVAAETTTKPQEKDYLPTIKQDVDSPSKTNPEKKQGKTEDKDSTRNGGAKKDTSNGSTTKNTGSTKDNNVDVEIIVNPPGTSTGDKNSATDTKPQQGTTGGGSNSWLPTQPL
ncbi:LCP family protein [Desulforamulus aeronauticus]|uniref:Transcriptional attenuator, LytR family n=1 Tax=Desulforamulus aeronauticus DSM 10349 TaxID=1121421 RepID=A0A1M6V8S0_9FIRM|nr:LCP family protein [Desulforamulus aeronauticus]SHK77771.1 transcriptional attenuator, LytR family [Desulforamulus aeronauticus DSM 10349]